MSVLPTLRFFLPQIHKLLNLRRVTRHDLLQAVDVNT